MVSSKIYSDVVSWKIPLHKARAYLAKNYIKLLPRLEVIGITGSVGKTLTQNAIAAVLSQKFKVVQGDENLDPTFRIPKTILATKPWHQKLILEYGVEHPGDMDHYLSITKPKIAVMTVISPTHTRYFGSTQGVFSEKLKLLKVLDKNDYAILNADDPHVIKMAKMTDSKVVWYGKKAKDSVKISHFSQNLSGSKFRLHWHSQKATVSWKAVGRHQLLSAYAAATVGALSGLTLKQIAKGLSQTVPPKHRLNLIVTKKLNIIDDSYNASPKAATESLKTLKELGKRKYKIAVFGQMRDLGKLSQEAHLQLGVAITKSGINFLVTVGKMAQIIALSAQKSGFRGKIFKARDTKEASGKLKKIASSKSLILIKGSRHEHLERIVQFLQNKPTQIRCYHCGILS